MVVSRLRWSIIAGVVSAVTITLVCPCIVITEVHPLSGDLSPEGLSRRAQNPNPSIETRTGTVRGLWNLRPPPIFTPIGGGIARYVLVDWERLALEVGLLAAVLVPAGWFLGPTLDRGAVRFWQAMRRK